MFMREGGAQELKERKIADVKQLVYYKRLYGKEMQF